MEQKTVNSFKIWDYTFDGAYLSPDQLQPQPGVYIVWGVDGDIWTPLDAGESEDVKNRLKTHDRKPDWKRCNKGTFYYSATYIQDKNYGRDDARRRIVERIIRSQVNPLCGDR